MFKFLLTLSATLFLTGCSYLHVHKQDITQGNVVTPAMISQLHRGMSEEQVKLIMGEPMLANRFSPNRLDYVYTMQPGGKAMTVQKVSVRFDRGRLTSIEQS